MRRGKEDGGGMRVERRGDGREERTRVNQSTAEKSRGKRATELSVL